ncbi:hypothetical protein [Streptomyces olivaceoviridis]
MTTLNTSVLNRFQRAVEAVTAANRALARIHGVGVVPRGGRHDDRRTGAFGGDQSGPPASAPCPTPRRSAPTPTRHAMMCRDTAATLALVVVTGSLLSVLLLSVT